MNARLDAILPDARTALSADEQEELAGLIEAYVTNHAETPDLT